jgi:hypothetical protein
MSIFRSVVQINAASALQMLMRAAMMQRYTAEESDEEAMPSSSAVATPQSLSR